MKCILQLVVLLISLILYTGPAFTEVNDGPATRQFDFANGLYSREMFKLAIIEYKEFIDQFPDDSRIGEALYYLGESFLKEKTTTEAEKSFDKYLTLFPKGERTALLFYRKGKKAFSEQDYSSSIELLKKSLHARPNEELSVRIHFYLGKSFLEIEDYNGVINAFGFISDKTPSMYSVALIGLATAYENTNQLPESINPLKTFIKMYPDNGLVPSVRLRLSTNLITLGNYKNAVTELKAILDGPAKDEIREKAYYQLCWCYYDMKDYEKILSKAKEYTELFPESKYMTEAVFLQAGANYEIKRYKESLKLYQKVIQRNDSEKCNAESYYRAGIISEMEGNYDGSINYFETFIDKHTTHKMINYAHIKLGEIYEKLNNHYPAIRHYIAYTDALPDGEYIEHSMFHLALCYYNVKEYESMASTFKDFTKKFPESPQINEALYYLGWDLQRKEDFQNAIPLFKKAFSGRKYLETTLVEDISYRLAICYYITEQFDKAAKGLYRIIKGKNQKTIPENLLLWLGQYQADNSEYKKAVTTYNILLDKYKDSEWTERSLFRLGEWYTQLKNWKKSKANYQKLLKAFPETELISFVRLGIAETNRNLGKLDEAKQVYEELAEDSVTMVSARAKIGIGYIYQANGKCEDAIRSFMYVAILFDDVDLCSRALMETSKCWLLLDDKDKATKMLEELITRYPESPLIEDAREKLTGLRTS